MHFSDIKVQIQMSTILLLSILFGVLRIPLVCVLKKNHSTRIFFWRWNVIGINLTHFSSQLSSWNRYEFGDCDDYGHDAFHVTSFIL